MSYIKQTFFDFTLQGRSPLRMLSSCCLAGALILEAGSVMAQQGNVSLSDKAQVSTTNEADQKQDKPFLALRLNENQYEVRAYRNGAAEYIGYRDVKTIGAVKYQLTPNKVEATIARLRSVDLDALMARKDLALTISRPTDVLTLDLDGKEKVIRFRSHWTLSELELFRDLEVLLDTEQFRCPFGEKTITRYDRKYTFDICNNSIEKNKILIEEFRTSAQESAKGGK